VHPFRVAWRTHDLTAWADAMAEDIVLYSPIIDKPFVGRDAAIELFGVLFDSLSVFDITGEFADGDTHVFLWRATARRRSFEGIDVIRSNGDGKICEIRVQIRPLTGIGRFAAAIGPPLAHRRGPIWGTTLRLLAPSVSATFAAINVIAMRFTTRRSSRPG
jgi:hypothetical protein